WQNQSQKRKGSSIVNFIHRISTLEILWMGEKTNRSELRCGEDDVTASRSEIRCVEDDGRRAGPSPLWSGRDDELNFDIYMFKYQFLSSYQNVNRDGARSYESEGPKDYNLLGNVKPRFSNQH
ncbi:unnamed protein product, partial [Brassica napus]